MADEKKKPAPWTLLDMFDEAAAETAKAAKDAADAAQKLLDEKKAADEKEAKKKEVFALMDEWADENLEAPATKDTPKQKPVKKEGAEK